MPRMSQHKPNPKKRKDVHHTEIVALGGGFAIVVMLATIPLAGFLFHYLRSGE